MRQARDTVSNQHTDMPGNALKGAIAGVLGVCAMDRLNWFLFERQPAQVHQCIKEVCPKGLDPAHVATGKVARLFGKELRPAQPQPTGMQDQPLLEARSIAIAFRAWMTGHQ